MIEAILWDNDGVLVDTESLFFAVTSEVLARAGTPVTRDEFIDHVLRSGRNLFDRLSARGWSPADIAALRLERNAHYTELLRRGNPLIAGAAETVRKLAPRYRMAIVTSSLRAHLEMGHQHSGILGLFDPIVTREEYDKSKPHPEPYLTTLVRMDLSPAKCVVIEDSERGLASALAAGLRCLIVPNELTRGSAFIGAAAVLEAIEAVPDAIEALKGVPL
ncbi:MAG: HAD family hydrolase [Candidatus Binataceae bacterium]